MKIINFKYSIYCCYCNKLVPPELVDIYDNNVIIY